MSNNKKNLKDDNFEIFKNIRKPKCKPSRVMLSEKDESFKHKFNWRKLMMED